MAKRKAISTRTRFEIFKRDQFTCQYCGRRPPQVLLQIDHVVPVAAGGDNGKLNLVTACEDCNGGKSDRPLNSILPNQRKELKRLKDLAEQTRALNEFMIAEREETDAAVRRLAIHWCDCCSNCPETIGQYLAGAPRQRSIAIFLKSLPEQEILLAMETAHSRWPVYGLDVSDEITWKYFCGICWRTIKGDRQ